MHEENLLFLYVYFHDLNSYWDKEIVKNRRQRVNVNLRKFKSINQTAYHFIPLIFISDLYPLQIVTD